MEHVPVVESHASDVGDLRGRRHRRSDYPAPSDMTEAQRLIAAGLLLQRTTLVGNAAPVVEQIWQRMCYPRPGDLVWETSTAHRSLRDPAWAEKALGWFVERGRSPWVSREEWASDDCEWREYAGQPYEECPTRLVWVIRPWGDPEGRFVWEDAQLLGLPLDWSAEEMFN